jgi:hypothetical protein
MKLFLTEVIRREADKLLAQMLKTPPIGTSGDAGTAGASFGNVVRPPYENLRANVLSKALTEVDLFDAKLSALAQQAQASGNQVTVTGAGNVVLTGVFTGSPMSITIDAGARAEIERALAIVEAALASVPQPTSFNVADVQEMVAESKAELVKPQPNSTKLGTMLMGVATTIQTAGAMRPAYDALKGLFAMFGITLP